MADSHDKLFIGGEWVSPSSSARIHVRPDPRALGEHGGSLVRAPACRGHRAGLYRHIAGRCNHVGIPRPLDRGYPARWLAGPAGNPDVRPPAPASFLALAGRRDISPEHAGSGHGPRPAVPVSYHLVFASQVFLWIVLGAVAGWAAVDLRPAIAMAIWITSSYLPYLQDAGLQTSPYVVWALQWQVPAAGSAVIAAAAIWRLRRQAVL
jgi:hypothetical protein